jgi:Uma2 family endonuclease
MALLVLDPRIEERLKAERAAWGADHHDEVWDGVYVMSPEPNDEHQGFVTEWIYILQGLIGLAGRGVVRPGVNISDREEDWTRNYRIPDVAVFLSGGSARNCGTHWVGGPDFALEITSPGDRTREKLDFYGKVGVRELLVIDRSPWLLELYRLADGALTSAGVSSVENPIMLASAVPPLYFRMVEGPERPQVRVSHADGVQTWRL